MKKNNTMRIAAGLAVAALLSTCLVSGTYAKYVKSDTSDDNARVAKFGVTVTAADGSAFKTAYDGTVVSDNGTDRVVAPGTAGQMTAVQLSGKPEVKVAVSNDATVDLGENWKVGTDFYCPLEVTVGTVTLKGTDSAYTSVDDFETAIKNEIDRTSATYDANANLATNGCPVISWKWAYTGNDDTKDTALGDAAAAGNAATISISVKTTVTQID